MRESDRVCRSLKGRAYCGRQNKNHTDSWQRTTCVDCRAAGRADGIRLPH
ncbi:hypothetical protein GCM10009862_16380 [Microbacterium binotii]|uniref:Uncharacterized protein n=1 Tax=Microbacterium binotii TaxID=462710 RepID=A0ABP6BQY4_9MICO